MYDEGDVTLPIICCLYKKLGTNKYCRSTKAIECRAFAVDKELCDTIEKKMRTCYIEIWERKKELPIQLVEDSSFVTFAPTFVVTYFVAILLLGVEVWLYYILIINLL